MLPRRRHGVEGGYEHAAEQQCSATFLWSAPAGDGTGGKPGVSTDDDSYPERVEELTGSARGHRISADSLWEGVVGAVAWVPSR